MLFSNTRRNAKTCTLVVFFFAALPRAGLMYAAKEYGYPLDEGDARHYLLQAENLFQNSCFSVSNPAFGECEPTAFANHHYPLLPFLLAAGWKLFGKDTVLSLGSIIILFSLAVALLHWTIAQAFPDQPLPWVISLTVALSPFTLPYFRFVLTEGLSLVWILFLVSALLRSIIVGRLSMIWIAFSYYMAVMTRTDNILLCVPIATVGMILHPVHVALKKGMLIAFMATIMPLSWSIRNLGHDLAVFPLSPYPMVIDIESATEVQRVEGGYDIWWRTWASSNDDEVEWASWSANFLHRDGTEFGRDVPDKMLFHPEQKLQLATLFEAIRSYSGRVLKPEHNEAFFRLALENVQLHPLQVYPEVPRLIVLSNQQNPFKIMRLLRLDMYFTLQNVDM